jgi:RNAse (barnase) inhibitor barstar
VASRLIRTADDLDALFTLFGNMKLPLTLSWTLGRDRTVDQNRLQRLWCNEIAEQLGDRTAEEVRGESKLRFAVPILRAEDEEFCTAYDKAIKPLPYEAKLACMMEPIDFPVTRRFKVPQMVRFLDEMHRYWSEHGVRLTNPDPELAAYQARYRDKPQEQAA